MRAGIRSRPWAGIDIGTYSVKLVALQGGVGGSRYWMAETRLPAPEPDQPLSADAVAKCIGECLGRAGLSARSFRGVSVGIAGADVIVKQIGLPLLDDDEVGPALRFEARKHLPFDPQGMVIDFQVLGRYPSEKRLDVLLAAVAQDHMQRHLEPFKLLGMETDILDAAPLALANALTHNADLSREAHVLLDLGHSASHLTLVQRGEPFFTRRIDFGGLSITRAIAKGTSVPFEEAEEWKLAAGSETPVFKVDWSMPEMAAILECLRHELVEEVRRSFAFYRTVGNLPEMLRVWISGGSARLPGLAAHLTDLLGVPVLLFNPVQFLNGDPRGGHRPSVGPQFAQAFGLAARTA